MDLIERIDRNREAIRSAVEQAVARALTEGRTVSFIDPSADTRIIEQLPDGTTRVVSSPRRSKRTEAVAREPV